MLFIFFAINLYRCVLSYRTTLVCRYLIVFSLVVKVAPALMPPVATHALHLYFKFLFICLFHNSYIEPSHFALAQATIVSVDFVRIKHWPFTFVFLLIDLFHSIPL